MLSFCTLSQRALLGLFLAIVIPPHAATAKAAAMPQAATAATNTGAASASPAKSMATSSPAVAPTPARVAPSAVKPASLPSNQTFSQQIASLPKLPNPGIDTVAGGKDILAHLNAVLRYYRESMGQAQKLGEPSDVLYMQQSATQATQASQAAFLAARNVAELFMRLQSNGSSTQAANNDEQKGDEQKQPSESQRLADIRARVQARANDLAAQDAALDKQIQTAKAKDLPALRQKDEELEGQLELQKAMLDALGKMASMAEAQTSTGLVGEIDRLLRAAPELGAPTAGTPAAAPSPVLESLNDARSSGVSSQAMALFQLLSTRRDIDSRIRDVEALRKQAVNLRRPVVSLLRATVSQGNDAMQQLPNISDAQALHALRARYDSLSATFHVLTNVSLPITQEVVLLDASRANLVSWRNAIDAEYNSILRSLLLRVATIAVALLILFVISQVWQRLSIKYIRDIRRRRQLLIIRRTVIGFLGGIIVIFGFVTQFSSLATFAGFITAGIAVGLQTILLSVAAYFFIIGRYGVRVGDRISVAGVTGDVIEVGLVRFYMSELIGTGTELHPTGRIAVFANSVLFQAGTPLYKQMPGSDYSWHEIVVNLKPDEDYKPATHAVLDAVTSTYDSYRPHIEGQHRRVEQWMDAAVKSPAVEGRLQLTDAGLQYAVLFPVETKHAAATDQKIVQAVLHEMAGDETVSKAISSPPTIRAVVKG